METKPVRIDFGFCSPRRMSQENRQRNNFLFSHLSMNTFKEEHVLQNSFDFNKKVEFKKARPFLSLRLSLHLRLFTILAKDTTSMCETRMHWKLRLKISWLKHLVSLWQDQGKQWAQPRKGNTKQKTELSAWWETNNNLVFIPDAQILRNVFPGQDSNVCFSVAGPFATTWM